MENFKVNDFTPSNVNFTSSIKLDATSVCGNIGLQVQTDLKKYKINLGFSENSDRFFMKYITDHTGISKTVLFDLLSARHRKPRFNTLHRLYCHMYQTRDLKIIIKKSHPVIAQYFKNNSFLIQNESTTNASRETNDFVLKNEVRRLTYLMTAGNGSSLDAIQNKLGQRGLEELQKLLKEEIVREDKDGMYKRGKNAIQYDTEAINQLSLDAISHFATKDEDEKSGYAGFKVTQVSPEAKEAIIQIMRNSMAQINSIIKEDDQKSSIESQTEKFFAAINLGDI